MLFACDQHLRPETPVVVLDPHCLLVMVRKIGRGAVSALVRVPDKSQEASRSESKDRK